MGSSFCGRRARLHTHSAPWSAYGAVYATADRGITCEKLGTGGRQLSVAVVHVVDDWGQQERRCFRHTLLLLLLLLLDDLTCPFLLVVVHPLAAQVWPHSVDQAWPCASHNIVIIYHYYLSWVSSSHLAIAATTPQPHTPQGRCVPYGPATRMAARGEKFWRMFLARRQRQDILAAFATSSAVRRGSPHGSARMSVSTCSGCRRL